MEIKLRDWQTDAYKAWETNNSNGTILAATAAGKTFLGINAILNETGKVYIVVPTEYLQTQWIEEINKFTEEIIGTLGGQNFGEERITVAIINSIRSKNISCELLIIDEAHRALSEENCVFISFSKFKKVMALTATIKRADQRDKEFLQTYPICYEMTQKESIEKGYICDYELENIPLKFTEKEKEVYDILDLRVSQAFHGYKSLDNIQRGVRRGEYKAINCMRYITKRKMFINSCTAKNEKVIELLKENKEGKIIVFFESVENLENLKDLYHIKCRELALKDDWTLWDRTTTPAKYYGRMTKRSKLKEMEAFKTGLTNVLLCVRALDEGMNVPEADTAIIHSSSSVKRQFIQRVGRVLRQKEGKKAKVYQLYIKDTKDEDWLKKRMK